MKAYRIEQFHSIDGIVMDEREVSQPGPKGVLIKLRAVSLNRRDLYILDKVYPLPPKQGIVPLSDGAGEVVSVGTDVVRFKPGDRVAGNYFPRWRSGDVGWDVADQLGCTVDGMLSEYALLQEDELVQVPASLSWEEAATLPCAALTAWSALTGAKAVQPGDTVLTMGSGGVPLFAIQFARMMGARVIALTSRPERFETLKSLGAHHVINYKESQEWSKEVLQVTGGLGVNQVVETGGTDTFDESVKCTAFGGELALISPYGSATEIKTPLPEILNRLFVGLITVKPLFVGSRTGFEQMNMAIDLNKIKPVIASVFPFGDAREAYRFFAKGRQIGKVVITVDS